MTARNKLLEAPPYPVERGLTRLGGDLRTARLRRNLTIEEVAEKIGAGSRAVSAAEKGNPSTGAIVYAALLFGLGAIGAGRIIGVDEYPESTSIVENNPWLRYLLG